MTDHDPICAELDLAVLAPTDSQSVYKVELLCICDHLYEARSEGILEGHDMGKHAKPEPMNPDHDRLCVNHSGSCCPWIEDCTCQCMCDFIKEIRDDERTKQQRLTQSTITYSNPAITTTTGFTYTITSSSPKGPDPVCENCQENCMEPLPMSKRTKRVYEALFRGPNAPLKWDESDDCGVRELMRDIAEAAAYKPKKGKKK